MNPAARTKISYWVFTSLFVLPLAASGLGFCISPPAVVEGMTHLGYPGYIIRFLGAAKLLGVAAVLVDSFPRLTEWAYAGLVFTLVGASYSHLRSGDGIKALSPLVILVFLLLSHLYWLRRREVIPTQTPKAP
jgi:hypothetical protein